MSNGDMLDLVYRCNDIIPLDAFYQADRHISYLGHNVSHYNGIFQYKIHLVYVYQYSFTNYYHIPITSIRFYTNTLLGAIYHQITVQ